MLRLETGSKGKLHKACFQVVHKIPKEGELFHSLTLDAFNMQAFLDFKKPIHLEDKSFPACSEFDWSYREPLLKIGDDSDEGEGMNLRMLLRSSSTQFSTINKMKSSKL